MIKRVLVGVVGVPLLLCILCWFPIWTTLLFLILLTIVASFELLNAIMKDKNRAMETSIIPSISSISVLLLVYVETVIGKNNMLAVLSKNVLFLLYLALVVFAVFNYGKNRELRFVEICSILIAGILIPISFSCLLRLRAETFGTAFVLIPLITAFCSDTMALFGGMLFGKHKLAPLASPHKTIEGSVSGLFGSIIGMLLFKIIVDNIFNIHLALFTIIIVAILGGIAGQLGDLIFSIIKREYGIKDYGNLLPGHGGVLDRFDSVLLTAPVVWFVISQLSLY